MEMVVDAQLCTASGECMQVCPQGAITLVDGVASVNQELCDFDGLCIPACPHGAISFIE